MFSRAHKMFTGYCFLCLSHEAGLQTFWEEAQVPADQGVTGSHPQISVQLLTSAMISLGCWYTQLIVQEVQSFLPGTFGKQAVCLLT